MNKNFNIFLILLIIFNCIMVLGVTFLIEGIKLFIMFSINGIYKLIPGLILIVSGYIISLLFVDFTIPQRDFQNQRHYQEERKVIYNFYLMDMIALLSGMTFVLFIAVKFGIALAGNYFDMLEEYYLILFSVMVGGIWGYSLSEILKLGNYIKYGKHYQRNIYWTREIEGRTDWYKNIQSYDENIELLKHSLIVHSLFFSLTFFVLFPLFQIIFDKFFPA